MTSEKEFVPLFGVDIFFLQVKSGDNATELMEKVSKIVGKFGDE